MTDEDKRTKSTSPASEPKNVDSSAPADSNGPTKERAREMERQIDAPGDAEVHVKSGEEQAQDAEKARKEGQETMVKQTNRGLGKDGEGKIYKDERIVPSDTNAPDAGLAPDGTRIAS